MKFTRKIRVAQSDTRGRVSLKRYTDNSLHIVDVDSEGIITLTPVVIMPRETAEKIDEFLDNPSTGIRVVRPTPRYQEIGQ